MEKYGFHYLTDAPRKIIDSYKKREKKIIEELKFAKESLKQFPIIEPQLSIHQLELISEMEDSYKAKLMSMENVIAYFHDGILSVYSIWDDYNSPWIGFDLNGRYKSQQKTKLMVAQTDDEFEIGFWRDGVIYNMYDNQHNFTGQHVDELIALIEEKYIQNSDGKRLSEEWFPPDARSIDEMSEALGFPLLLPVNWKERWSIKQISEHIFLAEDRNE